MAAFRGELNWALTRVLRLRYQQPMKRQQPSPCCQGELYLIGRVSAKVKLQYKYDRKEDSEFMQPISNTDGLIQYRFELMQSTQMMSPWSIPAVSSVSPYTSSYIMSLFTKWGIDLYAAPLEVKPSSIAIHYAHSTWKSMDSVWRKFSPRQNDSNQAIVHNSSGLPYEVSFQVRDYQPPHSGNQLVSVGIYCTGTVAMARRSVLFPTPNWCVLGRTKKAHRKLESLKVHVRCDRERERASVIKGFNCRW